ncbi:MAG: hypothetical protein Q9176_004896 [Flavoplaca citrina]
MLGLSTFATGEEVREACEEFASLAGAVTGARGSLVKQRVVAEVCAVVGFPRDPYLSTKFHEETLPKTAESSVSKHPKPTKEEQAASETFVLSGCDPYLVTKFHEEKLAKIVESTVSTYPKPTKEEQAAWETLVPSGDHGPEHDEASGKPSLSMKENLIGGSGELDSDDVEGKAPPNDREADTIPAIIQRSLVRRNTSAFRQWRQQRARASL